MKRAAAALAMVMAVAACGGSTGAAGPPPGPLPTAASPAGPAAASVPPTAVPTPPGGPVFVIVMENKDYATAVAQPYTASLAAHYAVIPDYHAVAHPSLPNYLALTAGSTFGVTDDGYHVLPDTGLGRQLSDAGVDWRAYMEGMGQGCRNSPYPYALKHDPFAYYGGACPPQVVPMAGLAADLAGATPRFVWITPGLCHDGHDCSAATADRFLSGLVPEILASPAWRRGGALFLVWDENDGGAGNAVLCLAITAGGFQAGPGPHDHYSLLATIEDRLGLPRLGSAAAAQPVGTFTTG